MEDHTVRRGSSGDSIRTIIPVVDARTVAYLRAFFVDPPVDAGLDHFFVCVLSFGALKTQVIHGVDHLDRPINIILHPAD